MAQQVRQRRQRVINYSAGNVVTEELSRGMILRELYLRLQGAPTVTGANNSAANTLRGDEWAVVRQIRIIANGTDVIASVDGNGLWWQNFFLYGGAPRVTPTIGDGSTANPVFDSTLILPFWMPLSRRPIDTALDTRRLSSLQVEITWGSHVDINGSATAFTTAPTIELHTLESFNVDPRLRFSQFRRFIIEQSISAANPRFQVRLPVGPLYRGFLFNTTNATADLNTILQNVRVISGTTVFADIPGGVIQQVSKLRHGNQRGYSGTAYDDLRQGNNNDYDGWYFLNFVTDGFLSESIDTLGFSEFDLELDVLAPAGATLRVYPLQIIPVRG